VSVLGRWLREWWDNPLFKQTDPDRIVVAACVPLWAWPMLRGRLREEGLKVEAAEESQYPGGPSTVTPMTNVVCHARDRDRVREVVDSVMDTREQG